MQRHNRPATIRLSPGESSAFVSHHDHSWRSCSFEHTFTKLLIVAAGTTAYDDGRAHAELRAGSLVVLPPGLGHRLTDDPADPPVVWGWCHAQSPLTPVVSRALATLTERFAPATPGRLGASELAEAGRLLSALLASQAEAPAGLRTWARALLLVDHLLTIGSEYPAHQSQVTRSCLQRLRARIDHPWRLEELAASCGVSIRTLTAHVRRDTGGSVGDWLRRERIRRACQLLAQGSSVVAVALQVGYQDLSHFYRHFKRQTGQPPGVWQRAMPPG